MKAFVVWRYVSRNPPRILAIAFDQSGLQSAMSAQAVRVRHQFWPLRLDYANPPRASMVTGESVAESLEVDWTDFINERHTSYETPACT